MKQLPTGYLDGKNIIKLYENKSEEYWIATGKKRVLLLFSMMAQRVPAYKDFLRKHKINYKKVKTFSNFEQIPTIDKDTYLRKYPLPELCWDGILTKGQSIISATSGSTGEPFYFPHNQNQDLQYAAVAEAYLLTNFHIDKKSTLYIIGFPMGVWIGGLFTYQTLNYIAIRGDYDMSVIAPGINKEEIIKAVKKIGHLYDQIIIGSYGPFLKDVLDDGENEGINWKDYSIGLVFSAEGFSEKFRDYVLEKVGAKNTYTASLNHYGTVDLGTMAYETPLAILARRKALEMKGLYKNLFGDINRLPTLCQYDPQLFYFESIPENRLICSAYSGIPLVRYDLKDDGGVVSFGEVEKRSLSSGIDLKDEAKIGNIAHTVWPLPFVYVYERSDFSVSFHAFQIYPETIRKALQNDKLFDKVTGKFTMMVKFDSRQNQYFEVNIEMKSRIQSAKTLEKVVEYQVFKQLIEENSEYRETYRQKGKKILPRIVLWPYEDPLYFRPGTKQKWVKLN